MKQNLRRHLADARALTFFDFLASIRHNLLGIGLCWALGLGLAGLYLSMQPQRFRAYVELVPSQPAEITGINALIRAMNLPLEDNGVREEGAEKVDALTPISTFQLFARQARLEQSQHDFADGQAAAGPDHAWPEEALIEVFETTRDQMPLLQVVVTAADPQQATYIAQKLLERSLQGSQGAMAEMLQAYLAGRQALLKKHVDTLERLAALKRRVYMQQLQDAYGLAKSMNLEEPMLVRSSDGDADLQSTLYMRGTRALLAEIENLSHRSDDSPYIPRLPELLYAMERLGQVNIEPGNWQLVGISTFSPSQSIGPRRWVVFGLGLGFGVLLSVLFLLTRLALQRRRARGSSELEERG